MSEATVTLDVPPQFPELPPALSSVRRRLWHRCVLKTISPLRWLGPINSEATGILTYHRVAENVGADPAMLNVSPIRFHEQLLGLLRLGYEPVSLRSLVESWHTQKVLSPRQFVVVFDDGFGDIHRHAWPVLRELRIPATIFLATSYIDSDEPFPFDDWSQDSDATARPLTTEECHEMHASGLIELGSHTHRHEDFRGRPSDFRTDLQQSIRFLRDRFEVESPLFSFPYGFASAQLAAIARDTGLACSLTADCHRVTKNDDPFQWGRFGAIELDTARSLAAKLDGWYTFCQNLWRSGRRKKPLCRSVSQSPDGNAT
jgi:peptidoglycan/xylan/chitin deacetylase (PgdA/CDA1 family)